MTDASIDSRAPNADEWQDLLDRAERKTLSSKAHNFKLKRLGSCLALAATLGVAFAVPLLLSHESAWTIAESRSAAMVMLALAVLATASLALLSTLKRPSLFLITDAGAHGVLDHDVDRVVGLRTLGSVGFDNAIDAPDHTLNQIMRSGCDEVMIVSPSARVGEVGILLSGLNQRTLDVTWLEPPPRDTRRTLDIRTRKRIITAPLNLWQASLKRAMDICGSACVLVLFSPLMLLIAAAIKMSSTGPVLFVQDRYGRDGVPFPIYKFRTLKLEACDAADAKHVQQVTERDPRVTPLGRFLRRSSLDELPQVFNVLRGQMSLVGPRPHAIAHDHYFAGFVDGYFKRLRVKPGITGLAQVRGQRGEIRDPSEIAARVKSDLAYIENYSLWLDVRLLLKTVGFGFLSDRAY